MVPRMAIFRQAYAKKRANERFLPTEYISAFTFSLAFMCAFLIATKVFKIQNGGPFGERFLKIDFKFDTSKELPLK